MIRFDWKQQSFNPAPARCDRNTPRESIHEHPIPTQYRTIQLVVQLAAASFDPHRSPLQKNEGIGAAHRVEEYCKEQPTARRIAYIYEPDHHGEIFSRQALHCPQEKHVVARFSSSIDQQQRHSISTEICTIQRGDGSNSSSQGGISNGAKHIPNRRDPALQPTTAIIAPRPSPRPAPPRQHPHAPSATLHPATSPSLRFPLSEKRPHCAGQRSKERNEN